MPFAFVPGLYLTDQAHQIHLPSNRLLRHHISSSDQICLSRICRRQALHSQHNKVMGFKQFWFEYLVLGWPSGPVPDPEYPGFRISYTDSGYYVRHLATEAHPKPVIVGPFGDVCDIARRRERKRILCDLTKRQAPGEKQPL